MCFGSRSRKVAATPEMINSTQKMETYFNEYLTHVYAFLLGEVSPSRKAVLRPTVKYTLDNIKAKMQAHANRHVIKYNASIADHMNCLHLVESQFNVTLAALYNENLLEIQAPLHKLKSVQDMFGLIAAPTQ